MATMAGTDNAAVEQSPAPGPTHLQGAAGPVGRTVEWLAARPWRGAVVVFGLLLLQAAWAHAVLWLGNWVAAGTLDSTSLVLAVYSPAALGGLAFGLHIARQALNSFWPATSWPDAERADWARRFMATPAK